MDPVEDIKSRVSIEDVVGRVVDLRRSGSSLKGLCPFHDEKTPSFYVTPSRGSFHCFGCGRGGDIFSFVMESERLTFPETLRRLADQAGIQLPARDRIGPSLKNQILEANESAALFYRQTLESAQGQRAHAYLQSRQFDEQAENLFGLGYAPEQRDAVVQHLRSSGLLDTVILAAGLAREDETNHTLRDYFRARLMFPIRDGGGKAIGFGARTLMDQQPKYLNSPQTDVFDKSGVLFGIHLAADPIRQRKLVVVVEGYLDALRAHVAGFRNTVAILGTAVTARHLTALARLAPTVVLALDPDPAGQTAAARTALAALAEVTAKRGREAGAQASLDLRIARLPRDRGDPDELIRDSPAVWDEAILAAIPAFEFFFDETMQSLDRSSEAWRQEAIDRLLPVIQQFATSTGWQALWMQRLAREAGLDPRALQQALTSARPSGRRQAPSRPQSSMSKDVVAGTTSHAMAADPVGLQEQALLALLLSILVVPSDSAAEIADVPWERPEHATIADALLKWRGTGSYDYELFLERLPNEVQDYCQSLRKRECPLPADGQSGVAITLHIRQLERQRVRSQIRLAETALSEVEPEDQVKITTSLLHSIARLREVEGEFDDLSRRVIREGGAI